MKLSSSSYDGELFSAGARFFLLAGLVLLVLDCMTNGINGLIEDDLDQSVMCQLVGEDSVWSTIRERRVRTYHLALVLDLVNLRVGRCSMSTILLLLQFTDYLGSFSLQFVVQI